MKKQLFFAAMLMIGMVCLTACGDDEPTPTPTSVDYKVQKAGPVTFIYDNYDHFDGFMLNGKSYHVDENNNLSFSYYDLFADDDARHITNQLSMKINDRGLVSIIDFKIQFVYDEEEVEYRINGKMVYGYDKNEQVTGMTTKYRLEEIERENNTTKKDEVATLDMRHTTTWKNGLLTAFEVNEKSQWQKSELINNKYEDSSWNEQKKTTAIVNYSGQKNGSKQMPATLCNVLFLDMCIPMFAPLGMYGAGPEYLPKSCALHEEYTPEFGSVETDDDEVVFHYTTNADGTIASEWTDNEEPTEYQYSITRAIDDEQAKHIITGIRRLMKRN